VVGSRAALSECPTRSSTQPALAQRRRRRQIGKCAHDFDIEEFALGKLLRMRNNGFARVDMELDIVQAVVLPTWSSVFHRMFNRLGGGTNTRHL
jgi:hypothetical protein